ncbi:MAG: hypothetical protein K5640_09000 [Treponema sp.]|nr:hypothetical protein [Treponema sp.]
MSENVADILSSAVAPTSATSSAGAAGSNSGSLISSAAPTVQNTYTYFAEATAANADGTTSTATGSFNSETNPTEFGIALAAGKSWTITCGIKNAAGDVLLSDSYPSFTPTAANPVISHTFMLQYNSLGTGSISLVMTADSVITRVMATWYCLFSEN